MLKKIIFILSLCITISVFSACETPANPNNNNNSNGSDIYKNITTSTVTNVNKICSSNFLVNEELGRAAMDNPKTISTVSYIDKNLIKPFIFNNKNGKKYIFVGSSKYGSNLTKLTEDLIGFSFNNIYEVVNFNEDTLKLELSDSPLGRSGNALLNISTGKFYDFSDYSLYGLKTHNGNIITFGSLTAYTTEDTSYTANTIYKIDVKTLTATPLNNGKYNPLSGDFFIIDDDRILAYSTSYKPVIIFINSDRNLIPLDSNIDFNYKIKDTSVFYKHYNDPQIPLIIKDNKNNLHFFTHSFSNDMNNNNILKYATGKLELDSSTNKAFFKIISAVENSFEASQVDYYNLEFFKDNSNFTFDEEYHSNEYPHWGTYSIYDQSNYYLTNYKNTTIKLTIVDDNLTVEKINCPMNHLAQKKFAVKSDNFYYVENQSLYSYTLKDAAPKLLYTSDGLLPSITVSKNHIIFNKYIGKTNVGTFMISTNGGTPLQIAQHDAQVKSIIELNFN